MATLDEFAEVAVATYRHTGKSPTSSISDVNTLMRKMKEKGNIKKISGGTFLTRPTTLVENQTLKNYYGYEPGNVGASENLKEARIPWAQKMMFVTASGREMRANMGDTKLFDFVEAKLQAAKDTASNRMNIELYGDGSAYQAMAGLQQFIQSTGAGTYGSIDSTIYTRWKNQTATLTAGYTADDLENALDLIVKKCTDGNDSPDCAILTLDLFTLLEKNVHQRSRYMAHYMDPKAANVGVKNLYHGTLPVYWDVHTAFGESAETGYVMDTKNIELCEHPDADWSFGKPEKPVGSDTVVLMGIWQGNPICRKRRTQGLIRVV